jgi:hypothetical protein
MQIRSDRNFSRTDVDEEFWSCLRYMLHGDLRAKAHARYHAEIDILSAILSPDIYGIATFFSRLLG